MRVDKYTLAKMNKRLVLETIRNCGAINKSKIAKLTDLSIPTVMKITDELVAIGVVSSWGKQQRVSGKPPELFAFVEDSFYSIGADIGPTNLRVVVMDLGGRIIAENVKPTCNTQPAELLIERTAELITKTIEESKIDTLKILGIGVGIPGILEKKAGKVLFSPNFSWENVLVIEQLKEKLKIKNLSIMIENSNRALALGEQYFGEGVDNDYFICINLGYGIGSAVVVNGEFYTGSSDTVGEIGHITVEKDGPLCTCGNNGCLEALASGRAIAQYAKNAVLCGGASTLISQHARGNIEAIEAKTVFEAALLGDSLARDIVSKAGEYIGIGIANYINLLDPEKIILAGGLSQNEELVDQIKRVAKLRQMRFAARKVKIRVSKLGANATAIGAAALIIKRLIETGGATALKSLEEV